MWIHAFVNNITHVQINVYDRPTVGRSSADIWRLSADGFLIKCHRLTVWRSSADWRPMIGRPSADIIMEKSSKRHRWLNPGKSADRSTKLLTWVLRQKSRRPTKKSAKIGADVGRQSADVARFSHFWLTDRRATVGLGNVTVVISKFAARSYDQIYTQKQIICYNI